jgi:hypothetical protein
MRPELSIDSKWIFNLTNKVNMWRSYDVFLKMKNIYERLRMYKLVVSLTNYGSVNVCWHMLGTLPAI